MTRNEKMPDAGQNSHGLEISVSGKSLINDPDVRLRSELAAACRLSYRFKWNRSVLNHITARSLERPDRFLMNPIGLLWNEIVASDFILCDLDGGFENSGT